MNYFSFVKENLRWLAGGLLLTFFSSFGQTFFISLSGGEIRQAYGLSNGEFGSLYLIATLASAITLPFLGRIVDHVSVAKTALLVLPMLTVAAISMSLSTSVVLLGLTIYGLRLFGQGMMTHVAMTAVGRWYFGHRGRAVSIVTVGHQFGEAVFPSLFVAIVAVVGWRNGWLFAAGALMLIALPATIWLMRVERQPRSTDLPERLSPSRHWTRSEVVRDPYFWMMSAGVFAPAFIGTTIYFHQDYLLEIRNWPDGIFASSFLVMATMTTGCAFITGFLIDRVGAIRILPFFLFPLCLACTALWGIEQSWGIFVFMAFLGVSYGISSTLFGALWPEIYGTEHLGAVRSLCVALMVLMSALGPGVTGILIDLGVAYPSQVLFMGLYCLAASVVLLFVSRKIVARQNLSTHKPAHS